MATLPDIVAPAVDREDPPPRQQLKAVGTAPAVLPAWLRAQSINVRRHAAALRPLPSMIARW